MNKRQQALAALQWYDAMGVDETIEKEPVSRVKLAEANQAVQVQVLQEPAAQGFKAAAATLPKAPIAPAQGLSESKALADACNTLAELRAAVEGFHGLSIRKTAQNTVFGDGSPEAKVMFIGEAPGADEDRQGIPFCGASGQLLNQMLSCIGLDREKNFYITNTLFWRPPGNRRPTPEEIAICRPFVEKHIALVNPKLLVMVGGTAIDSVLDNGEKITKLRGSFMEYSNEFLKEPVQATAIFHPSYLLRSPGQKKLAWQDLLKMQEYLEKNGAL